MENILRLSFPRLSVIPAKAGIQLLMVFMDSHLHGSDK